MFLSFIIPLYNCEQYIAHCLDSILSCHIPYHQYEIIVVNDGSKDSGPIICESYAKKYEIIRLLYQENNGASAARNAGLDIAQGDYIWFIDGDDCVVPQFVEWAWRYLQSTCIDMLCFNHQKMYVDQISNMIEFNKILNITGLEFLKRHYSNFIWNKIYRQTSLGGKRFLTGTKNIEDMHFNINVIIDMINVLCVPKCGYLYNCTNLLSTSRNLCLRNLVKLDQDSVRVLFSLKELYDNQADKEKMLVMKEHLNFSITGHLYSLFKFYSPKRLSRRIAEYRRRNLYPVDRVYNSRGNLFLYVANREMLFLFLMRVGKLIKNLCDYHMLKSKK